MTTMTILDVVEIVYPGQIALGNVTFGQDTTGSPIFITSWKVPGQSQPDVATLEAMIPSLQNQFDLTYFMSQGAPLIAVYVDSVAQQKQYFSAVSCASYVSSTVAAWQAQAIAFVAWRDTVYSYCIAQEILMKNGSRSIPTFEEFQTELPAIVWPD